MKNSFYLILIGCVLLACSTSKPEVVMVTKTIATKDTIRIANDSLDYEVIIIDAGFSSWLDSRAYPRKYHSLNYLESKNQLYVSEWNNRVLQPQLYNPNLYEMTINYDPMLRYGYEVNYLIYNYMIYFQNTNKQKLFGTVPTR
ncbi:DUF6146 family protein [Flavobacterium restrictum]|uniref:Lipoprotein n=1 Tax=Flavobacterium restrictum TaxID=2594428 RepID=A0A553E737_9FLAO|nr:DUF6146 family protein [Flavobacterium restrictum]TRX40802.1 hypothetical protein FNW21_05740 [Flavobacterium restrictum]